MGKQLSFMGFLLIIKLAVTTNSNVVTQQNFNRLLTSGGATGIIPLLWNNTHDCTSSTIKRKSSEARHEVKLSTNLQASFSSGSGKQQQQ